MVSDIFEIIRRPASWLSRSANRQRLRGARVEVVVFLMARRPLPSLLLVESVYGSAWMPPQEGVGLSETWDSAIRRCLHDECGIDVPPDPKDRGRTFNVRTVRHLGTRTLPKDRWGERPIAEDAIGTILDKKRMTKKAYWGAIVIVNSMDDVHLEANQIEVTGVQWVSLEQARELIERDNPADKAQILLRGLALCEQHLFGVRAAAV